LAQFCKHIKTDKTRPYEHPLDPSGSFSISPCQVKLYVENIGSIKRGMDSFIGCKVSKLM
jgi:hypothetical protein